MTAEHKTSAAAEVVVRNAHGMHLRPATRFARIAMTTGCRIKVEANGAQANGTSVIELALLAAVQGTTVRISAERHGAENAVRLLVALVATDSVAT
jgi:PTS hybrid protein